MLINCVLHYTPPPRRKRRLGSIHESSKSPCPSDRPSKHRVHSISSMAIKATIVLHQLRLGGIFTGITLFIHLSDERTVTFLFSRLFQTRPGIEHTAYHIQSKRSIK